MNLTMDIFWSEVTTFLIPLFVVNFLIGLSGTPVTSVIFKKFKDSGYAFSHVLSLISISFLAFVFSYAFGLKSFYIYVALAIWVFINLYILHRTEQPVFTKQFLLNIVAGQMVFLTLVLIWYFVRAHEPEIYSIERFMDFGFIKSLFESPTLPPNDVWLTGHTVNYYYFGHFISYVFLNILGIQVVPGFFVLILWLFGVLGMCLYSLGRNLFAFMFPERKKALTHFAGIVTVFFVLFSGTLFSVRWLLKIGSSPWYPDPTRFIDFTITEMPFYSFLVSDLHAHVWGLLIGIVYLAVVLSLFFADKNRRSLFYPAVFGFLLGISFMTNSWDVLTLGIFSCVSILYLEQNKKRAVLTVAVSTLIALVISALWKKDFLAPTLGLGIVRAPSIPWKWFLYWGHFVLILVPFYILISRKKAGDFVKILAAVSMLFLVFMEIFYMKDIMYQGDWFRANTVFKISMQVWVWLGVGLGAAFTYFFFLVKKGWFGLLMKVVLLLFFLILAYYPVYAAKQSMLDGKKFTGISYGLSWMEKKYTNDYSAILFMEKYYKEHLYEPESKPPVIVEAVGESYQDGNFYSTLLGWPTVLGWPGHEWTWRNNVDELGLRRAEVDQIYTSGNAEIIKAVLNKYNIIYIFVGAVEKSKYGSEMKTEVFEKIAGVIYQNDSVTVYKVIH